MRIPLELVPVLLTIPALGLCEPSWIGEQYDDSLKMLLDNIYNNGTVIASPSQENPDYYWVRDAAMVMGHLVHRHQRGEVQHKDLILSYAQHEKRLQHTPNPSGTFLTTGLGEPKFNVDGSAYTLPWGRPQNDGPGLRALTLAKFSLDLLGTMSIDDFKSHYPYLYHPSPSETSVIKSDLEYITHHWRDLSYDPWEESYASEHFFNLIAMREALSYGIELAQKLDDGGAAKRYEIHRDEINHRIQKFWSTEENFIKSTMGHKSGVEWKIKNLDTAVLIAVLFANSSTGMDDISSLTSDEVLHTFVALNASFAKTYPINANQFSPCFGRYEEDRYDGTGFSGANPWFLTTLAAAEYLYAIVPQILSPTARGFNLSHPFFASYARPEHVVEFQQVLELQNDNEQLACKVVRDADGRLGWVKRYRLPARDLSEQFSRFDGKQIGAKKLTWSYEAFLKAIDRRRLLGDWIERCL